MLEPNFVGRRERGQQLAEENQVRRVGEQAYSVHSQFGQGLYTVNLTEKGWLCSCPDHIYREVKCKHIWAVEFSVRIREQVKREQENNPIVIQPVSVTTCLFCQSANLKRFGVRHNASGDIQRFLCVGCGRTFSVNIGFDRMRHNLQAITSAMQLYFNGESLRNVADSLRLLGAKVSHQTIYNWISKYSGLMLKYVEKITPNVSDTWRADELYLKVKGNLKYLFALMDDETRFWIAKEVADTKDTHDVSALFRSGKLAMGKKPALLITDGLKAYHEAYKQEYYAHRKEQQTIHVRHISLKGDRNNNRMERFNGEVRDREKVMRGLKTADTPVLSGYQIFHNYIRPHEGLDGKTPAEAAGITVQGENKWLTLIQNASRKR